MTTLETLDLDCEEPFTLSDPSIDLLNPTCKALGTSARHVCFLPNLTSFTYRGEVSFSLDALLRMIKGRLGHLQPKIAAFASAISLTKDRPSVAKLDVRIIYLNELWYHYQIPSALHDFYNNVALLNGIKFTIDYWESSETMSDEE
ncbi:hypothetical protein GALMADRAFT_139055 [Galerina marginata CBS 339.88]|uniref:Uncharacterized protein n=1 Tax=Galerina marginata (strain CBS 339.88) TaxID=685588 RepID=A0A067T1H6_GALM3|nr:hypothetical protein GALMADRAFT_139055 [Galerina marginata CBS 339.88]